MVIRVNLAYRSNAIIASIAPVVTGLFMISLLRGTLFSPSDYDQAGLSAYYTLLVCTANAVIPSIWPDVFAEIRNGRIIYALVRPFSYLADLLWGGIGSSLFKLASGLIPMGLVYTVARPNLSAHNVIAFLAFSLPAILLSVALSTLFSLSSFWILDDTGPSFFLWYLAMFSSGAIIPLSIMPGWARILFSVLPFRYLIDFPVTASLGLLESRQIFVGIISQCCWLVLTLCLCGLAWARGRQRLSLGGL